MTRMNVSACALLVAASLAGCAGTGDVQYAGEVHVTSPQLVQVSPGVQVLADADEPIFYVSGDYWLYRDGYWFRSDYYQTGYARVEYRRVPQELRDVERPQLYAHYNRNRDRLRAARESNMRTRSQPTPLAPMQQQTPAPEQEQASPTGPSAYPGTTPPDLRDNPQLPGEQPRGINPDETTPPPGAVPPSTSPDTMRPVNPPASPRSNSDSARDSDERGNTSSQERTGRDDDGVVNQQDRADRGTPPTKNNPDNRARDGQTKRSQTQSTNPEDKKVDE